MLKRRWPRPILASTKIPASSGPRCVITSRMRSRTRESTERPERDDKAIPLIPHILIRVTPCKPLADSSRRFHRRLAEASGDHAARQSRFQKCARSVPRFLERLRHQAKEILLALPNPWPERRSRGRTPPSSLHNTPKSSHLPSSIQHP